MCGARLDSPIQRRGQTPFLKKRALCNIVLRGRPLTIGFEVPLESDPVLPGLIRKLNGNHR